MEFLPNEIIVNILEDVSSIKDIVLFGETCRYFHDFVKAEDTRLVRRTYGNLFIEGIKRRCLVHITPSSILHGRAVFDRVNSILACTFVMGKMQGTYMSVSKISTSTGKFHNDMSVGMCETKRGNVITERCLWGEEGRLLLSQTSRSYCELTGPPMIFVHVVSLGWRNTYAEASSSPFYCQKKNATIHKLYTKIMRISWQRNFQIKRCYTVHRQCCKEHRNGMPKHFFSYLKKFEIEQAMFSFLPQVI
ncbi:hypothetical protein LAU_0010 [Lausannevirus]|uniref:F-box domain-containing protein n=1 Tax=Lausannevirus TaxID=999883 RepID=F2WKU3_9VIRU|nr:hypothetical protein LAU_0010 [Lausannevirus]AEA06866.1 hypothetical protein LAU_0010 [Lausannevirus]